MNFLYQALLDRKTPVRASCLALNASLHSQATTCQCKNEDSLEALPNGPKDKKTSEYDASIKLASNNAPTRNGSSSSKIGWD